MRLCIVNIRLIERLELEDLLTQLQVDIIDVVQFSVFLVKLLSILIHQLCHLVQIQISD